MHNKNTISTPSNAISNACDRLAGLLQNDFGVNNIAGREYYVQLHAGAFFNAFLELAELCEHESSRKEPHLPVTVGEVLDTLFSHIKTRVNDPALHQRAIRKCLAYFRAMGDQGYYFDSTLLDADHRADLGNAGIPVTENNPRNFVLHVGDNRNSHSRAYTIMRPSSAERWAAMAVSLGLDETTVELVRKEASTLLPPVKQPERPKEGHLRLQFGGVLNRVGQFFNGLRGKENVAPR